MNELGFDACVDHRRGDFADALTAACPKGIDINFENVGDPVFDAVLPLLNTFARVPVCGLIAHYNATELPGGVDRVPLLLHQVLVKRLTVADSSCSTLPANSRSFWPRSGPWYATAGSSTAKISSTGWRKRREP